MKKNKPIFIYILTLILFLFEGCISFRGGCNEDIEGRYFSERKAKNIINYLDLKKDGTYYHYYKEDNVEVNCSGKWEKVNDPYCKIRLYNWKNFNVKGLNFEYFKRTIFYINNQYLDRTPDGNSLESFKKEK